MAETKIGITMAQYDIWYQINEIQFVSKIFNIFQKFSGQVDILEE